MPRYTVETLVDITRTNPDREEKDSVRLAQQSNFNSLVQGIGMRANVIWDQDPIKKVEDNSATWTWQFEVERDALFEKNGDQTYLLRQDLNGIPIIKNLENTDPLQTPVFITDGPNTNIWIKTFS